MPTLGTSLLICPPSGLCVCYELCGLAIATNLKLVEESLQILKMQSPTLFWHFT